MEFKIGDRVAVKSIDAVGVITDIFFSNKSNRNVYDVRLSDDRIGVFEAFDLTPMKDKQYRFCTVVEDGVVIVTMEESMGHDDLWKVVARGHGHLIHDGEAGLTQAFSYAARRLWHQVDPDSGYCNHN